MAVHARLLYCDRRETIKLPKHVRVVEVIEDNCFKLRATAYSSIRPGTLIPTISLEDAINTPVVNCECRWCEKA